ncbi:hypothetical protein OQA88_1921 [Cercophora sp. LCS_1]
MDTDPYSEVNETSEPPVEEVPAAEDLLEDRQYYFTDGSPYWTAEEHEASRIALAHNQAYRQALLHVSATHAPSMDRIIPGPPFHSLEKALKPMPFEWGTPDTTTISTTSWDHDVLDSPVLTGTPFSMPSPAHRVYRFSSTDPRVASPESHAQIDDGSSHAKTPSVAETEGFRLFPPNDKAWTASVHQTPALGPMYQELMDGNPCEVCVDISPHLQHTRSPLVKVRPAAGVAPYTSSPLMGHTGVPKVGALGHILPFEYRNSTLRAMGASKDPDHTGPSGEVHLYPQAMETRHQANTISRNLCPGHSGESKVRSAQLDYSTPVLEDTSDLSGKPHHVLSPRFPSCHECRALSEHSEHGAYSKCSYSGETPSGNPRDPLDSFALNRTSSDYGTSSRSRRAETSRSASDLVAYWESIHQSAKSHKPSVPENDAVAVEGSISRARAFTVEKSGVKWASWFRNLMTTPAAYKPNLTQLPKKRRVLSARNADTLRDLTHSATPRDVDTEFKKTIDNLEHLLDEAMVLASQVADREDQECIEDLELAEVDKYGAPHSPPSVHESLPSDIESSIDELPQMQIKGMVVNGDWPLMGDKPGQRQPKHYRSAPGMRNRNVMVEIPARTSSLLKSTLDSRYWLVDPEDKRFQQPRWSSTPSKPISTNRQTWEEHSPLDLSENEDSTSNSRCLPRGKIVRRIRSRLHRHSSFHRMGDGTSSCRDDDLERGEIPVTARKPVQGRNRGPLSCNYDGANDEEVHWPEELETHQATSGAQPPNDTPIRRRPGSASVPREVHSDPEQETMSRRARINNSFRLRGRAHLSIRGHQGFNLARAYRRQPVARDWSTARKRFVAAVACISTAAIGVLIGIYAGLVPSIQYWIADLYHYAILGNVYFYLGLAIPTFFFWPLPLLHGRKPYILSSLVLAMPLLFPQAISVSYLRSPYVSTWR